MALDRYNAKRDFSRTREPRGKAGAAQAGDGHAYVIQKHDARRLHYDLRLELDGVLLSWAVTRGPSLVPGEKRLAVHVEDHPLAYGDFEGTIPKGEYGGGTVIVWDRGTWSPIGDPHRGLKKGHLEFELSGEKLTGRWHLVRMRTRETRENWLLIKGEDEAAHPPDAPDILEERPESVKTGRLVADVEDEAPGWSSKTGPLPPPQDAPRTRAKAATAKKGTARTTAKVATETASKTAAKPPVTRTRDHASADPMPSFLPPVLATRVRVPPAGPDWRHEIKFDGYRLQVHIKDGAVRLLTRSGLDWTDRFGDTLRAALLALPVTRAILDGEVVVEGAGGASDFSALQADLSEGRTDRFRLYLFDIMYLDGADLTRRPLSERQEALGRLLDGVADPLRLSAHFGDDGALVLRHACRLSLEGVVSKRADSPYRAGRGRSWVKSRCAERQELVVAGYVPASTEPNAIGALVLGYYSDGALVHAGRVGTGFSRAVAHDLHERLQALRRARSPFKGRLSSEASRGVVFVAPECVAEIEFTGWTAEGSVRHASFRGLREDKPAKEVVRERPAAPRDAPQADLQPAAPAIRSTVKLTHPDRIYWPDAGVTKAGLADHYALVWRRMAPFVVNRPLALVRCPEGIEGQCFFQKHAWRGASKAIHLAADPKDKAGAGLLTVRDLDGLIGLVQAGVLEIHPWGAALDALERPDQVIFDLDPGEGVAWDAMLAAAREVRERLSEKGLPSFVKTSGGKGLHVVAPLVPRADWTQVKAFARALAQDMAADAPEAYVATITKAKRTGRILVDYLRNGRGNTAVAPYSTRARPGAPVSMPLDWSELSSDLRADHFTVQNTPARLSAIDDPWADFRTAAHPLPTGGTKGAKERSGKGRSAEGTPGKPRPRSASRRSAR